MSAPLIVPASTIPASGIGPLILPTKHRWGRDAEVAGLVEHFDQKERQWLEAGGRGDILNTLSKKECEILAAEIDRCRKDFSYTARNYFWIIDRDSRVDQLFKLWEAQEMILDVILRLKAQGKCQRIMIIKARQLGSSTLAESLIAWRTMLFTNSDAFVVSFKDSHAAYLFKMIQHIYDKLPWWMRPKLASREFKSSMIFDNPNYEDRKLNPGLNSQITCEGATATTSVGQGRTLAAVHLSEWADYVASKAREIIEEDIRNALADHPNNFGILESTAKGAGNYSHKFWLHMVELAERADWTPIFLPWFFDRSRHIFPLPSGWKAQREEEDIRERAVQDWVRCDNALCLQYKRRHEKHIDLDGATCSLCHTGTLHPFVISDNQLAWMEERRVNAKRDEESQNVLRSEMCVAGETRISTQHGILPIAEAKGISRTDCGQVAQWFNNGVKPVLRLTTEYGRVLRATPDHRILLAKGEWRELQNLLPGDVLKLSETTFSEDYYVAQIPFTHSANIHITIDEKWGRFLGYYMGDGCWMGHCGGVGIAVFMGDPDIKEEVIDSLRHVIDHEPLIQVTKTSGRCWVVRSNDKRWYTLALGLGLVEKKQYGEHGHGFQYIRKVHVPECIWRSPKSVVKEFLSALFESDAHAYKQGPRSSLSSKSEDFLRDVQILLGGFGINSIITKNDKVNSSGRRYVGRTLTARGEQSNRFHAEIGFRSKRKKETACVRPIKTPGRKNLQLDGMDRVKTIAPDGEANVYDISVVVSHRYGANGITVHNCSTAEEAFTVTGIKLFSEESYRYAISTVREPIAHGFLDRYGMFHGVNGKTGKCFREGCEVDHSYDDDTLKIWQFPNSTAEYSLGGDVADGLGGDNDYSSFHVIKKNPFGGADEHVATFSSNTISAEAFADVVNKAGRYYNNALVATELNTTAGGVCSHALRIRYQYPNLYRPVNYSSLNPESSVIGWKTTPGTKPRLYHSLRGALDRRMVTIRDHFTVTELHNFRREEETKQSMGAAVGHDDRVMAFMIAYTIAHERDWDELGGIMRFDVQLTLDTAPYSFFCEGCSLLWPARKPTEFQQCPRCRSHCIQSRENTNPGAQEQQNPEPEVFFPDNERWEPNYDDL